MGKIKSAKEIGRDISKGLKQAVTFVGDQLRHPAVKNFVGNAAEIMATSNGDPEAAAMRMGELGGQEMNRVINRTIDHYTGHQTAGDKSMPPAMNALTFI
jgi:hypothetical protein